MKNVRPLHQLLAAAGVVLTAIAPLALAPSVAHAQSAPPGHHDPKGKGPSKFTLDVLERSRATLPFGDTRDFDEQKKGFIAPMKDAQDPRRRGPRRVGPGALPVPPAEGRVRLDPPVAHADPKLNMNYGLYEVVPGIYQVRGFDLADISFVRGKTGWIVIDPLTAAETARAAVKLFQEHVGKGQPITAVIYSHSHGDHFGGVRGVVDEADVRAGKVQIIAPRDFMQHTISENVYAGNAMNRRLFYQYGVLLPASPYGHAGQGLGMNIAAGSSGLIAPTRVVEKDIEEFEVDGVRMVFQNTPNTEAPSQMNTYIPALKALWMAENVTGTLHNIYTLRGAQVRDPLNWSKYIARALYLYGKEAEVMFASHHWPRWGNARIQEVLRGQRDLYANMNNQVLHLANQGVTINEIHNVYKVPASLQQMWFARGYHGSPEHNSRGVVQRFLGYLRRQPGHADPAIAGRLGAAVRRDDGRRRQDHRRGKQLHDAGQVPARAPRSSTSSSTPSRATRPRDDLLADVFEQLGYRAENPGLRNSFLQGAYELRSGIPGGGLAPLQRPRRDPRDVDRAVARLRRHPHGQPKGGRHALHDQPDHAGQRREVRRRDGERDAHHVTGFLAPKPDLT